MPYPFKAFVLTKIDESTAESTTWRSPRKGTWCFDSEQLKATWYMTSKTIQFDGNKAKDLTERIQRVLSKADEPKNVRHIDLNKSIECFMTEASEDSSDETLRLCTSLLEVRNISCRNNNEENFSESLNIHESDEATNSKLDMAKVINPNDLHTNEPLNVLGQRVPIISDIAHQNQLDFETTRAKSRAMSYE